MSNVKQKKRKVQQHKASILGITGVVLLLAIILTVGSISQKQKLDERKDQQAVLEEQVEEERQRAEELDELEEYVGTDEYVEDVAKDKMGMIKENEIIFKAEP